MLGSIALLTLTGTALGADGSGDPAAVTEQDGKFFDAQGNPTFKIGNKGETDWYTYSGFRRHHSECHVCHGPAGEGSTYAPGLVQSMKTMPYADFQNVAVNGRVNVGSGQESVMPSFGTNPNAMCYLDDIYIYLRARTNGAVDRVRPPKHADKPATFAEAENSCMGH
ncbi:c-type cytochrome, methanol metabolism-related [Flaviflagellibacter deserti]|uniref:C-type cytochrome, methanol metabolism-related n=1 Tax=Flaviflagellibacter deserti TaxID=2267266 RepID=A0ABV9Z002_9HYPH